jgi:hypothetical protein
VAQACRAFLHPLLVLGAIFHSIALYVVQPHHLQPQQPCFHSETNHFGSAWGSCSPPPTSHNTPHHTTPHTHTTHTHTHTSHTHTQTNKQTNKRTHTHTHTHTHLLTKPPFHTLNGVHPVTTTGTLLSLSARCSSRQCFASRGPRTATRITRGLSRAVVRVVSTTSLPMSHTIWSSTSTPTIRRHQWWLLNTLQVNTVCPLTALRTSYGVWTCSPIFWVRSTRLRCGATMQRL